MLEKDYNIYIVDDVFDDNFACDFKAQSVEEKYGDSDEKIEYIKGIIFGNLLDCWGKCIHRKNVFFDDDSTINIEKYAEISRFPEIDSSFITEEEYYKYLVAEYEEGYDEEYIYHDRDMDYDYDYENDCEYDGDEELYGYDE